MGILKKPFDDEEDDPVEKVQEENKRVWDRLKQMERNQEELSQRVTQIELRSGIFQRR